MEESAEPLPPQQEVVAPALTGILGAPT
ncbi:unnamed protein product, partial [Rotaria socialis]